MIFKAFHKNLLHKSLKCKNLSDIFDRWTGRRADQQF